ncbi:hypothetical protein MNB_SM-4-398 [hydrothermal vent metagenome]|uniref:DUF3187 domain-containing protein n=1 Tax=hydrothermal vent metagenome TaxID=652676 RepID=A0A1W1BJV7_9ZZZZ
MKNLFVICILAFSSTLFAYIDSDFDGVEDTFDKCPNTPFTQLVDINGCTTKSLVSPHKADIIVGASYSDSNYQTLNATDTYSTTIQVDYYYENFSLQASTSYFLTSASGYTNTGLNDSFVGAAYQFRPFDSLSVRVGAGALLPTYETSLNNNKTDYTGSINLSYTISKVSLFGGYSYTLINDDDTVVTYDDNTTQEINYQNTSALSGGIGFYMSDSLYTSISYNTSDSIYTTVEDIETASLYAYYGINEHWFSTFSYARGISESASENYASIRLGYLF